MKWLFWIVVLTMLVIGGCSAFQPRQPVPFEYVVLATPDAASLDTARVDLERCGWRQLGMPFVASINNYHPGFGLQMIRGPLPLNMQKLLETPPRGKQL